MYYIEIVVVSPIAIEIKQVQPLFASTVLTGPTGPQGGLGALANIIISNTVPEKSQLWRYMDRYKHLILT